MIIGILFWASTILCAHELNNCNTQTIRIGSFEAPMIDHVLNLCKDPENYGDILKVYYKHTISLNGPQRRGTRSTVLKINIKDIFERKYSEFYYFLSRGDYFFDTITKHAESCDINHSCIEKCKTYYRLFIGSKTSDLRDWYIAEKLEKNFTKKFTLFDEKK